MSSTLEQVNPKLPPQRQRRQLREAAGLSRSNLATRERCAKWKNRIPPYHQGGGRLTTVGAASR